MRGNLLFRLSAVALAAAPLSVARADLVLVGPTEIGGTGLGAVSTILTIQNTGTEVGSVCRVGSADVVGATVSAGGVCSGTGNTQASNQTVVFSNAAGPIGGTLTAANFGIVFNASQPAGGPITLNDLTVTFYSSTGAFLYQASTNPLNEPFNFASTATGTGNSGNLFVLNAAQQAAAIAAGAFSSQTNRVGLAATASNASGGLETFFLANTGAATVTPEPSTTALMATGLFGLVGFVRRRRRS
jgi:hypothetical protein